MAYQYLLNFLIREQTSTVEFEVRESHWLRVQDLMGHEPSFYCSRRLITFDTVDGLAVAVGCDYVQLVRFLYNPVQFPSDQKHSEDNVQVWLRGREDSIEIRIDDAESLAAFFVALDAGVEFEQFPGLVDEDGELTRFNCDDLVLVTAPLHKVSEGHREMIGDGQADHEGDSSDIPF